MKAIVHHPDSQSGRDGLALKVAEVHAEAVMTRINKLSCSVNEKKLLYEAVIVIHRDFEESAQNNPI